MTRFSQVTAALRKKNWSQYTLLAGCCFFSVLLITAYVTMMCSPTVLTVLPEGGDSRKQVMMIFVLAVMGCAVFTTYASGLFFRYKSREVGTFLALGASKHMLRRLLAKELAFLSVTSCALGAILGTPLAWMLWQLFRLLIVDSEQMTFVLAAQTYLFAAAFSVFVFLMLFVMLIRFLKRTNILDVINESRKSERFRAVPRYYGWLGILLIIAGCALGYLMPSFFILGLHWYPPSGLTSLFYLPALMGLYMILLHTVVNGWHRGKARYKQLISTSMMQFQGRQTVRNMLVVAVLVAGAYFASFYTPLLGTGAMMSFDTRPVDFMFHYRCDQDMPTQEEIRSLADEMNVTITRFTVQPGAVLGVDGIKAVETQSSMGTTYEEVYLQLLGSDVFLSESAYNALTGECVDVAAGSSAAVFSDEGQSESRTTNDVTLVTNAITGKTLSVVPRKEVLKSTMLFGRRVLDDQDYARITQGLPADWREQIVFFDVEDPEESYDFAKVLFNQIVDRSGPEVELYDAWDPVKRQLDLESGKNYIFDPANLKENNIESIEYDQRDSSNFRLHWKYMPQFRALDKSEFVKTMAVFLMLFIFIAALCFAAVVVILFTRSMTIAMTNSRVYDDLRHLGASDRYLYHTVRTQISRVFFTPILTGMLLIGGFYGMILYFNDNRFSASEAAGAVNCLLLVAVVSALLYGVYRITLSRVCRALEIRTK